MGGAKLIIEVYEYTEDGFIMPRFKYIPCVVAKCVKRNRATLKEIIQRGLMHKPDELKEILRKVEEAGIDKIDVLYHKASKVSESYIELTNVVPVSMADADASRTLNKKRHDIILYGKYQLSDGTEITRLKDAQRLSLIYSDGIERNAGFEEAYSNNDRDIAKEICLNITYIQE